MSETQTYFIDIINLVPDGSVCFIQAPDIENSQILDLLSPSPFEYYKQIVLTPSNKLFLCNAVFAENVEEYFQSIEIRFNDKLLYEGYDGMEFGVISKNLQLTNQFINNYLSKEMYTISEEW